MTEQLHRVRQFTTHGLAWGVAGPLGGIHIWCNVDFRYGGLEVHRPATDKADNENCWLIGCPCNHDGSSLWWDERGCSLVGFAMCDRNDEAIWRFLEQQYAECLGSHL